MSAICLDTSVTRVPQPLFDFNAEHNGERCIASLRPEDAHTCNAFWFSVAMLCTIYEVADQTIRDNIEGLIEDGEISIPKFRDTVKVPASDGKFYETTIYNLEVLNKLGMCCFRKNKKAKEIRNKFNDVLVAAETQLPTRPIPRSFPEALRAYADEVEAHEATKKALEEKTEENEALREQIGNSKTYKAVTAITWLPDYFDLSNRGLYGSLASKLKNVEAEMGAGFEHTVIPDSRYGTVKAYHVDVIERLHAMIQADETLMVKYRKIASI